MAAPRGKKKVHAGYLKKAPSAVHEGFAAYIAETTGQEVDAQTVSVVQRLYPLYLKSPAVVKAREEQKAEREKEAAEKKAAKERRVKERLAKIEAQRAKLLADLGIEDAAEAEVIEAADRFEQPEPEEDPTDASEEEVEEDDSEPEEEDSSDSDDDEETAEEVDLADDDDDEDEDDDDWDDDEDDEEDF